MNVNHDKWHLPLFKATLIAAIFSSTLSQVTSVKAREKVEPNIENRLIKVRDRLKQIRQKSDTLLSLDNNIEIRKNQIIQAQYWSDGWNDWSNWSDWSDWSNGWSDWSNGWNDWSNWSNYYW